MKLHHIASSLPHAANLWLQELSMQHCIASSLKINQDRARLVSSNRDWLAYHTNILHSLYVYVEETIMPPLVLPSGPKPCVGKKRNRFHASGSHDNVIFWLHIFCNEENQYTLWETISVCGLVNAIQFEASIEGKLCWKILGIKYFSLFCSEDGVCTCESNSTCSRIERSYICGCNRGFQSAKDNGTDCAGSGFQMNI